MRASGPFGRAAPSDRRSLFYYITDRKQLAGVTLAGRIRRAVDQGVDFIQIREKDLSDRELFLLTLDTVRFARGTGCKVLVNGRADIALAAGADGVHLPSGGLQVPDLRTWLQRHFIVGVSVHSMQEASRAASLGADYLLLGPIYPTESKIRYGLPLGIARFRRICASVPIPILGLGGIRPESISEVLAAGAAGVAGISLFQGDFDLRRFLRRSSSTMFPHRLSPRSLTSPREPRPQTSS